MSSGSEHSNNIFRLVEERSAKICQALESKKSRRRRAADALATVAAISESVSPSPTRLPLTPSVQEQPTTLDNLEMQDKELSLGRTDLSQCYSGPVSAVDALAEQMEHTMHSLAISQIECTALKARCEEAESRCVHLEAALADTTQTRDSLIAELEDMRSGEAGYEPPGSPEVIKMSYESLVELSQKLKAELRAAKSQLLGAQLSETQKRLTEAESEVAELVPIAMRAAQLKSDNELEDRLKAAQTEILDNQTKMLELKQQLSSFKRQLKEKPESEIEAELNQMKEKCEKQAEQLTVMNAELSQSQEIMLKWKNRCKALEKEKKRDVPPTPTGSRAHSRAGSRAGTPRGETKYV